MTPFSRTGIPADIAGSLAKALKLNGHEVRMITPRYLTIRERRFGLRDVARLRELKIEFGKQVYECSVKSGFVPGSKVQVYFLDNRDFYKEPIPEEAFSENGGDTRQHIGYALLNHAALQLMMLLHWIPDIIYCNSWQTALTPYLVKFAERYKAAFQDTHTAVNINSLIKQGFFRAETAEELGFGNDEVKQGDILECEGDISFLKAGLQTTDQIFTINPAVSQEIKSNSDQIKCNLIEILNERKSDFHDVLKDVGATKWHTLTDRHIPRISGNSELLESKAENRKAILEELKLPLDDNDPIIVMNADILPADEIKRFAEFADELASMNVKIIIIGAENYPDKAKIQTLQDKYPGKVSTIPVDNDALEHQLLAGSDILFLPSNSEASLFYQFRAMVFGVVPVSLNSELIGDSIIDYNTDQANGTGFLCAISDGQEVMDSLKSALNLFSDPAAWHKLRERVMGIDHSWKYVARQFVQEFENASERSVHLE